MKKTIENEIDNLLIFMCNDIEQNGWTIKNCHFEFDENKEDAQKYLESSELSYEELKKIINACLSREYLKRLYMGKSMTVQLTPEGQGRGISSKLKDFSDNRIPKGSNIHIGTLNASGNTQIGDNNIQNITETLKVLKEEIESSNCSDIDKKSALNTLKDLVNQPAVVSIIGAVASSLG